ncbi:hypothetical protein ACNI3Q_10060 [Sphingomonas sp. FW199]|uniref:hypothetical protein n=1 Tax=Sphingomonas sp. FW199 TaxID=3400217 RepID=UPI003CEFB03E
MAENSVNRLSSRRQTFVDLCEETTGFGEIEFRTFRDLLIRPRVALEHYLIHGPTGGQRYARPFGFYMGLCGILMFYLFLVGGMKGVIEVQPASMIDPWLVQSGKSREAFIDDAESWMSLVVTPVIAVLNALLAAPLLKWWSGLDWRRSFRSANVLMCAWTVPILFIGPAPQIEGLQVYALLVMWAALFVAFFRLGKGLWFTAWWEGALKSLLLVIILMIASWIGMVPSLYIGLIGGAWGA